MQLIHICNRSWTNNSSFVDSSGLEGGVSLSLGQPPRCLRACLELLKSPRASKKRRKRKGEKVDEEGPKGSRVSVPKITYKVEKEKDKERRRKLVQIRAENSSGSPRFSKDPGGLGPPLVARPPGDGSGGRGEVEMAFVSEGSQRRRPWTTRNDRWSEWKGSLAAAAD
ncbi:hypothetical protein CRG98_004557 [Punica granatum]|uniref:Uncharacterized protein n=1 Tax=Punica granatum TaxID=22663 RepID=A0A2I0L378_PUNGR|nr:hypothetical protein CRG98_004557 [Punica granatum]